MYRMHCLTTALAFAGLLSVAVLSPASAQTTRSYCLTGAGGELGLCGYPTFEACRIDSAGYGTCAASEQPAWGEATTKAPAQAKRKR
jgi:hypothetical protein